MAKQPLLALCFALICIPFAFCSVCQSTAGRSDGATLLLITPDGVSDQNPAFSPDGGLLLFTRFTSGYNERPAALYVLNLAHGTIEPLIEVEDADVVNLPGSSWNAVTRRITYTSDQEDTDEIWTADFDGDNPFRVTHSAAGSHYFEPSFSPDGEWIVFEKNQDVLIDEHHDSIWKVRVDGTDLIQLTDGPAEGVDDRQSNWSPDGQRILFQRHTPGSEDWDIYTMNPDGSDVRRVTKTSSSDTDASWSPDSRWIVYSSDYGGLDAPNVFVIPAEGGDPVTVTDDETRYDGAPSWSPDGMWIAFESYPGDEDAPASLWQIPAPSLDD